VRKSCILGENCRGKINICISAQLTLLKNDHTNIVYIYFLHFITEFTTPPSLDVSTAHRVPPPSFASVRASLVWARRILDILRK
jgi:hypothetical protein